MPCNNEYKKDDASILISDRVDFDTEDNGLCN